MKTVNYFFSTFCEKYIYCLVSKQEVRHTFRRAAMLDFQDVFYDVQGCMYLKKVIELWRARHFIRFVLDQKL